MFRDLVPSKVTMSDQLIALKACGAGLCVLKQGSVPKKSYTPKEAMGGDPLCEGYDHRILGAWKMFFGARCRHPQECENFWLTPDMIYIHGEFDECTRDNDIAIFEHSENIPNFMATPICLPTKNLKFSNKTEAAGVGLTGPKSSPRSRAPKRFRVIGNLVVKSARKKRLVVKRPLGKGLCEGDSGGPLFQYNENKPITQIGIASTFKPCNTYFNAALDDVEELDYHDSFDYYTDIREYIDWICGKTGSARMLPFIRFYENTCSIKFQHADVQPGPPNIGT
ncbi:hypothetical protein TELCIR_06417 [Teladorsagia circumcincta]|uniref:Peptidase S1 domain-containing protein n=1 Tax=Teladorsagia circumcincta TaxID=45464 RepID=A0A2G9UNE7_TELCI|nr:hypothetical protein TELCIR_06417 [Teladorsagia circumcincta]